jgi:hypothetical protein
MAPQQKKILRYHTLFISILLVMLGFMVDSGFRDMKDTFNIENVHQVNSITTVMTSAEKETIPETALALFRYK